MKNTGIPGIVVPQGENKSGGEEENENGQKWKEAEGGSSRIEFDSIQINEHGIEQAHI